MGFNQVLMLKRTYGNKGWSLPGGVVDPGETIHQALIRECREELGLDIYDIVLTEFIIIVISMLKLGYFAVQ